MSAHGLADMLHTLASLPAGTVLIETGVAAAAALIVQRWWHGLLVCAAVSAYAFAPHGSIRDLHLTRELVGNFLFLAGVFSSAMILKNALIWASRQWLRAALLCASAAAIVMPSAAKFAANRFAEVLPLQAADVKGAAAAFGLQCTPETLSVVDIPALPDFGGRKHKARPESRGAELPRVFAHLPVVKDTWKHFIGPATSIRSDAPREADEASHVTLTVVVAKTGDVLFAMPTAGPKTHYNTAKKIARGWKFSPFLARGKPAIVRVAAIGVPIDQPVKSRTREPITPHIAVWESVSLSLSRRAHGGSGPDFDVTVHGNGLVEYEGRSGVKYTGRHCALVRRPVVERLVEEFQRARFLSLEDRYVADMATADSVEMKMSFDGRSKGVYVYGEEFLDRLPDAIHALPPIIEHGLQVQRWTEGNRYTAPSLKAERWDISLLKSKTVKRGVEALGSDAETWKTVLELALGGDKGGAKSE